MTRRLSILLTPFALVLGIAIGGLLRAWDRRKHIWFVLLIALCVGCDKPVDESHPFQSYTNVYWVGGKTNYFTNNYIWTNTHQPHFISGWNTNTTSERKP